MSPLERKVQKLEELVATLLNLRNVQFEENLVERLGKRFDIPRAISDLSDVDSSGIANGQLLKWNSSTNQLEPADDIDT